MNRLKKAIIPGVLALTSSFAFAGGKTVVKDVPSYNQAVMEACSGSAVGAQCTITFQGGSVSIGVCVQVPGPAGGMLSCQIDPASIPSCKNSATGTPSMALAFAVFALGLFGLSRRRKA